MIPTIDIEPLFGPASPARERTDAAIMQAATGTGFMAITGPLDGSVKNLGRYAASRTACWPKRPSSTAALT